MYNIYNKKLIFIHSSDSTVQSLFNYYVHLPVLTKFHISSLTNFNTGTTHCITLHFLVSMQLWNCTSMILTKA